MGLGKLLTRQARGSDVETRAAGAGFEVIIDNTPVNFPFSIYRGGMAIPGAWRAAVLISDLLGSVPWHAFRERAGEAAMVAPTPPLLEQPAPPETRMNTFSSWGLDLLWHGNAVGIIAARNSDGWPTAALPVPAEMVGVRRVGWEAPSELPVGSIEYSIGTETYGSDDIIHFKGPCRPGEVRGLGVLEAHMDSLDLAHEQQRQASSISRHGVPTGVIKSANPDVTQLEADKLKAKWLKAQRERTVAVLNAVTDFQPLSWNPEELQMVEARKFTLHEIALIFGLPLYFLGADQSSRTYSNIEQEGINLVKFTLAGHLARFEQTLSQAFPRGTTVKANLDAILRADTMTRYQAHQLGLTGGFLTVDEVRELEDRPPLPDEPEPPPIPEPRSPLDGEDDEQQARSQSDLDNTPAGRRLWDYWTQGEGLAQWAGSAHPYTALVRALRRAGVPARSLHGLAANMFHAVFGIWPGERQRASDRSGVLADDEQRSQSNLDNTPEGRRLWDYWTKGPGRAKWAGSAHPYTALVRELRQAGVPARSVHGLAANLYHAVFGIWPGERGGNNPAGPG